SASIGKMFNVLFAKEFDIETLRLSYGVDTQRLKVDRLKSDMKLIISAFKLNVKMVANANRELDLHVIENAINKHLRYLDKCRNDKELNQKIAGFLDLQENNVDFANTLNEFNLLDEMATVKVAYKKYIDAQKRRVELLSQRSKTSSKSIIKSLFTIIDNLFKVIEVEQLMSAISNADLAENEAASVADFTPLINNLNQLSKMYQRSIYVREASSKKKSAVKQEETVSIEDENEVDNAAESIVNEHYPSEVYITAIKKRDARLVPTCSVVLQNNVFKKNNKLLDPEKLLQREPIYCNSQ
ncbi:MAG: hypothetical protein PHN55_01020, partial [Dysgonamonadaceae bacterium]|nr:hypothetical protein [Dysgonamonadaceae bacterium]